MRWLETKIPPPVVVVLLGTAGFGVSRVAPALSFDLPHSAWLALTAALAGLALNVIPKRSFRSARTTVNPIRPQLASALVTSGVYRYTRNPMYLGYLLVLLGWTLYLHNAASLLAVPAFVLYVTRFQILPEERFLSSRFPGEYAALCRQARRWL